MVAGTSGIEWDAVRGRCAHVPAFSQLPTLFCLLAEADLLKQICFRAGEGRHWCQGTDLKCGDGVGVGSDRGAEPVHGKLVL